MNKKPRKRYGSREEILADIERYKARLQRNLDRATSYDVTADEYVKYGTDNPELIGWNRQQAKRCRRTAYNIENGKLVYLKQKLAEFSTPTLPGVVADPSIQR